MHAPLVFFDGVHASVSTYMCIYIHTHKLSSFGVLAESASE